MTQQIPNKNSYKNKQMQILNTGHRSNQNELHYYEEHSTKRHSL